LGSSVVVVLIAVSPVAAAPIYFFGEDLKTGQKVRPAEPPALERQKFLAELVGVGTEDFESLALGTKPPVSLVFPGTAGTIGSTLVSPIGSIKDTLKDGRFPTSGRQFFESINFGVTFSKPIAALGFYATDVGDYSGQLRLTFFDGDTPKWSYDVPHFRGNNEMPDAPLFFFGVISTDLLFTRVDFVNTRYRFDAFGFDDMVIADAGQVGSGPPGSDVVEPAGVGLLLAGLVALGAQAGWGRRSRPRD
jgi:hypothetical protein